MTVPSNNQAYEHAQNMQRSAADPHTSVFVSANAGSGKTKVLVERVSRILLGGVRPDKILCLTYTKAAASEMQSRLFDVLGDWSVLSGEDLTKALGALEGNSRPRSDKELGRARKLFARALETPGGLKVQTIHAFCEKLLKRFPFEAGITPGTEALDDQDAQAMQLDVIANIQTLALSTDTEIAAVIALLSAHKNDKDMDTLYGWMMRNAYKIDAWQDAGGIDGVAKYLEIPANLTPEIAVVEAWECAPKAELKIAAQDMQGGGKTDIVKSNYILQALCAHSAAEAYAHYVQMFFTKADKPKPSARMVTAKAGDMALSLFGNAKDAPQGEAMRMIAARETVSRAQVLVITKAVYTLACVVIKKYRALKSARRLMDFDDQIEMARKLLLDVQARDWVAYKLDGGVDHILVDEAQDTSAVQWDIVDELSTPFFQMSPDADPRFTRTLFAVGDEKQSIYSFLGARPELFLEKIQALTKVQEDTPEIKMSMSFRSSTEILALVDQIFYVQNAIQDTFDSTAMPAASDVGFHSAFRQDGGVVEFWPAAQTPIIEDEEIPWEPVPVDTLGSSSSREQLARQIAQQIKQWLDNQEPVCDKKTGVRPMQARDILILVTKRTAFFDAVIRNLKAQNIPVAGADRLSLTDSIAVQDLLSLAKFALLPQDDLSLAEVLKSPLFGWSEQQLFDVAHGRSSSLWQALPDGDARGTLSHIRKLAAKYAPYEFFAQTLAFVPDKGGASLLHKIYSRLGLEVADALDAFLAQALAHQRRGAPSLTRFIADIESDERTIKREMDSGHDEVRVMTVHGAKGLEAPVVILPDTTQIKQTGKDPLYAVNGGFLANISARDKPQIMESVQDKQIALSAQESLRLLYVALTRAETRLLICGFESRGKVADDSWHHRIGLAMEAMGADSIETEFGEGMRYGQPVQRETDEQTPSSDIPETLPTLPEWAVTPLGPEHAPKIKYLSPSALRSDGESGTQASAPRRSPLWSVDGGGAPHDRFARGIHIHKLLQILPDVKTANRRKAAHNYLITHQKLDTKTVADIEAAVFGVLEHKDFAPFFAKPFGADISHAEISLAGRAQGLPEHIRLGGQIDRLCIVDGIVWILDYKSNRPPPQNEDKVAAIYIRQMAAYRALAKDIFKDMPVRTALLWTDGPRLMPLSDKILDAVNWDDVLPS